MACWKMPHSMLLPGLADARMRRSRMCCAIGKQGSSGWVHFVGIGGTGLSALALLALKQGWKVSGSDAAWSSRLQFLERAGATVYNGHSASQLQRYAGCMPDTVVVSSAIPADNEELRAARDFGIRVLKRADWLAEVTKNYDLIAVAGTHGKSTTTAMLAVVLQSLGEDITAIVGADVPQFPGGANVLCGNGRHFLLEADEYDGCFLGVSPSLAVVTNVEWEHVDMFPDEASTREMFKRFVARIEPDGCLVICGDSAGARSLTCSDDQDCAVHNIKSLKLITYGLHERNDWRALTLVPNLGGGTDYVAVYRNIPMARVNLKLPGLHNVMNSLAAVVAASTLGLKGKNIDIDDPHQLRAMCVRAQAASKALETFEGLSRRFDFIGAVRGCLIYDDYAHHPTEIRAVLQAARERHHQNPLWVVFQPHTYSRLAKLLDDFASAFIAADRVIVTEVFSAREENKWNISGSDLASAIKGPSAEFIATLDGVIERLSFSFEKYKVNNRGNIILLTLGAGDVTTIGPKLFDALTRSKPQNQVP